MTPRSLLAAPAMFLRFVHRLLWAPVFPDEEQTGRAGTFHAVIWGIMVIITGFIVGSVVRQPELLRRWVTAVFLVDAAGLGLLEVNRRGQTRLASHLLVAGLVALLTATSFNGGGVGGIGVNSYFICVLIAGLLLGERAGIATALVCAGLGWGLLWLEVHRKLPASVVHFASYNLWLRNCAYMAMVLLLSRLATRLVRTALSRARNEIAERERAEKSFRETKDQLQYILDNAQEAIFQLDLKGNYIYGNAAAARFTGYSQPQLLRMNVMELVAPEYHALIAGRLRERLGGGLEHETFEYEILHKDGRRIWGEVTTGNVYDSEKKLIAIQAVARDITLRKRDEHEIERLNRLYATLSRVNHTIARSHARGELFEEICRVMIDAGKFQSAEIVWRGHDGSTPALVAGCRVSEPAPAGPSARESKAESDLVAEVFQTGKTAVFHETQGSPQADDSTPQASGVARAYASLPLHLQGKLCGALVISSREAGFFDVAQVRLMEQIAADISFALDYLEQQEQLKKLARAVEQNPVSIVITDAAGEIEYVNPKFTEVTGYTPREAIGQNSRILKSGDMPAAVYEELWKTILAGNEWRGEFHNRRKNGELFWELASISPITDASGQLTHFVAVKEDITEQKRAQEETQRITHSLRSSERQFASAFENSAIGMALVGLDGRFLRVNRALCRMVGYSPAELSAKSFQEITQLDDLEKDLALVRRTLAGEIEGYEMEKRYLHKSGRVVWSLLSVTLVRNSLGQPVHFISQIQDITQRRSAETDLRSSEERFRQLAETIEEVFWISDASRNQIHYASPAYEKVWGSSRQLLYDQPGGWLKAVHREDRERMQRSAARQHDGAPYEEEYRIIRPDGQVRWIRDKAFPVHGARGEVERIVGVARDTTESRKMAEQLRQSQKMEAIGLLAGGVAHDFNNILAAMIMQAELCSDVRNQPDKVEEGLEQIRASANRAANLTRQLLLFSRKQMMQAVPLDVNEAVTKLAKMLQRIIGEDIRLQLHLHPASLMIHADPGMFDQILMNLSVNARDAMPHGGVLLVETQERDFDATSTPDPEAPPGRYACMEVSDTGTGISAEVLPHIFEPFFTTKEQGKGTGLGLATVFGIIKQHAGFIRVESETGRGTKFLVYLPITKAAAEPAAAKKRAMPRGGSETILLVEDEESLRSLASRVLQRSGYRVLEASNGVEAISIWEKEHQGIKLLLTDLVMPAGVNGKNLAGRLQEQNKDLKVIFMTGYSPEMAGRQLEMNLNENLLQKPFLPERLLETVRSSLDG